LTSPIELMDSFSETLLRDERILGFREKELLTNLLQRANTRDAAVNAAIAQTVGEIVAQRAYEVLGNSITRRLVAQANTNAFSVHLGPSPPSPMPQPPRPGPGVTTHLGPAPPSPMPQPPRPGPGVTTHLDPSATLHLPESRLSRWSEPGEVAVLEERVIRFANCVIFDEFLAPAEVDAVLQFALDHEAEFHVSEVLSPGVAGTSVDYDHRRSLVLMELGPHGDVIVNRLRSCWPRILQKLGHDAFVAPGVDVQMTASNDGDFFRCHKDNGQPECAEREITFVYFVHREPKQFRGGELRIYDSRWESGDYVRSDNYRAVIPQQNQLVVFASSLEHEITPVECASKEFADSRFTVNGWFHR
jgi:hypothetical protein